MYLHQHVFNYMQIKYITSQKGFVYNKNYTKRGGKSKFRPKRLYIIYA